MVRTLTKSQYNIYLDISCCLFVTCYAAGKNWIWFIALWWLQTSVLSVLPLMCALTYDKNDVTMPWISSFEGPGVEYPISCLILHNSVMVSMTTHPFSWSWMFWRNWMTSPPNQFTNLLFCLSFNTNSSFEFSSSVLNKLDLTNLLKRKEIFPSLYEHVHK